LQKRQNSRWLPTHTPEWVKASLFRVVVVIRADCVCGRLDSYSSSQGQWPDGSHPDPNCKSPRSRQHRPLIVVATFALPLSNKGQHSNSGAFRCPFPLKRTVLRSGCLRNSSGSFATLAAIRRASSLLSSLAAAHRRQPRGLGGIVRLTNHAQSDVFNGWIGDLPSFSPLRPELQRRR